MNQLQVQGDFFSGRDLSCNENTNKGLSLKKATLESWQTSIQDYQGKLFNKKLTHEDQYSLFEGDLTTSISSLDPLKLTPLPLNFWRWPTSSHHGPAIYLVMDKPTNCNSHLVLYIGETIASERRWKGEHDCKSYVEAYEEALQKADISTQLSIRFWTDVPKVTKSRRKLEQQLIQYWLPPFNKETRSRWSTPFTAQVHY